LQIASPFCIGKHANPRHYSARCLRQCGTEARSCSRPIRSLRELSDGSISSGQFHLVHVACATPTRSALGSCWRHKGHLVALLGSLNNSRMTVQCKAPRRQVPLKGNGSLTDQRAEHPAGCERIVPIRALLFPPRSLSGALFRRPNSHHSGESGNVGPNLKYFLSVPPWRAR
jgi:hypothetical protein